MGEVEYLTPYMFCKNSGTIVSRFAPRLARSSFTVYLTTVHACKTTLTDRFWTVSSTALFSSDKLI